MSKSNQRDINDDGNVHMETIWQRAIVTSYTWDRECHGLFDFDIQEIDQLKNEFIGCGYVQRQGQRINVQLPGLAHEQAEENKNRDKPEIENLISMVYKHGEYWLFHNQSIESDSYKHHIKMAWFVVRYQ